jgi:hypothetical protein
MAKSLLHLLVRTPEPSQPARSALRSHMAQVAKVNADRQAIASRDGDSRRDIDAAEQQHRMVATLRDAIDSARADAVYSNTAPPSSLLDQENRLKAEQAKLDRLEVKARAAVAVHTRYQADLTRLTEQVQALNKQVPALLHAALLEEIADHAAELQAAEERLRAVHRRVFVIATAADALARSHSLGMFIDSQSFSSLNIPKPRHSAFKIVTDDPYVNGRAIQEAIDSRSADQRQLEHDAETFVGQMLNR